jgi:hypothetical protein
MKHLDPQTGRVSILTPREPLASMPVIRRGRVRVIA